MLKNYFYLARIAGYLNQKILGFTISDIFTQEKDTLYIHLSGDETFPFKHLVLSTNNQLPYLQIKNDHRKAKKNITYFFENLHAAEVLSVTVALGERDIKIKTTKGDIHYVLRGNRSNIYCISSSGLLPFKAGKNDSRDNLFKEFSSQVYVSSPEIVFEPEILNDPKLGKKEYPFVSKELYKEAELLSTNADNFAEALELVISKIYNSDVSVYFDQFLEKVVFVPATFISYQIPDDSFTTCEINDAIREYLVLGFKSEKVSNISKDLQRYFEKELGKLSSKINNLKARIDAGSKHEEYYNFGNLLLANLYSFKKGEQSVVLADFNGIELNIKLNEKLSPNQNVEAYFEKAKNEKINFEKSKELYNNTVSKYEELVILYEKFENSDNFETLKEIHQIIFPAGNSKKMIQEDSKIKYRHYLIDAKYHVFVGKDSKSNDLLSTRFAKQNDYWFHARGLPGSHVVLRVENTKEVVPKTIIKSAASIAAFWSKAKTAKVAPVSYTFGKFVYKKKGFDPGQVALTKENVLLVKPEIPANTELIDE